MLKLLCSLPPQCIRLVKLPKCEATYFTDALVANGGPYIHRISSNNFLLKNKN